MARKSDYDYHSTLPYYKTLEFTKNIHSRFIEDKAEFILYSPTKYSDPYAANLLAKINSAEEAPPDETVLGGIQSLTDTVEQKHDVCRIKFQGLKNFVKEAWHDDAAKLSEFGGDNYEKARKDPWFMVPFMKYVYDRSVQYSAELDVAGFSAAKIAELETVRNELDTANQNQLLAINTRKNKTKQRRELNNAAYDAVRDLCEDGKIIFVHDFARHQLYLIPGLDKGSIVKGKVAKNSTENIWRRKMKPADQIKLENKGTTLLKFCVSPDGETACDLAGIELPAGTEKIISYSELGDMTNKFFNVTNKALENEGSYKVTVM